MNQTNIHVAELERLRRQLQQAKDSAGGIEDALSKGWIGERQRQEYVPKMRADSERAVSLELQLKELVTHHKRNATGAIPLWASTHLQVCDQLLQACLASYDTDAQIRAGCIGQIITQTGVLLSPNGFELRTNTHFLPNYDAIFDQLMSQA